MTRVYKNNDMGRVELAYDGTVRKSDNAPDFPVGMTATEEQFLSKGFEFWYELPDSRTNRRGIYEHSGSCKCWNQNRPDGCHCSDY